MKIYQSSILILTILFCSLSLTAQQNEFVVSIGTSQGYFKDSNFSPLNYQQQGTALRLAYTRYGKGNQYLFSAHLDFSYNTLHNNAAEHFTSEYIMGTISIDFLKKSTPFRNKSSYYLGGQIQTNNHVISYDGLESFSFMFNHSLSLKGFYTISIRSRHSFQTSLAIPLVNYMVRPPFNGNNKTIEANQERPLRLLTADGKITSVNTFLAVDWFSQYRYAVSRNFDIAVGCNLQYQRHKDMHHLARLENQLTISAIWKIGK